MPALLAAPGLLGYGRQTSFDTIASFIAGSSVLHGALILPVATARDLGNTLLAGRILLLTAAGLACAALLRTLELAGTALIGGVLYELASVSDMVTGWRALAALLVCPFFLACVERSVRGLTPSVLRLAVAISLVASLNSARLVLAFGVAWAAVRVASPGATDRSRMVFRLAVSAILGVLLASPLLFGPALRGEWPTIDVSGWLTFWSSQPSDRAKIAFVAAALLPIVGLACLAAVPIGRRGRAARVLLACVPIAVALLAFSPFSEGVSFDAACPLFLLCLVVLCCLALADQARREADGGLCVAVALGLLSGVVAGAVLHRVPMTLAVVNAMLLVVALTLSARTRGLWAAVPALVSAAWVAAATVA